MIVETRTEPHLPQHPIVLAGKRPKLLITDGLPAYHQAYLKGERLKGYNTLLWRIRTIGLKAIIEGCEHDLDLLKRLLRRGF